MRVSISIKLIFMRLRYMSTIMTLATLVMSVVAADPEAEGASTHPRVSVRYRAKIVFVSTGRGVGNSGIYLMNADGSGQRQLVATDNPISNLVFSPDASKMAWESRVYDKVGGGGPEVYVANVDGSGLKRLTHNDAPDEAPTFSPDGRRIAWVSGRLLGRYTQYRGIFVMNADGSGQRQLTNTSSREADWTEDYSPTWSPDGRRIAFSSHTQGSGKANVCVVNANGGRKVRLTAGMDPVWSPDGRRITFLKSSGYYSQVYLMNSNGSRVRRLSTANALRPQFSPDGRCVAFVSPVTQEYMGVGESRLVFVGVGDSHAVRATRKMRITSNPSWSPDGSRVVFALEANEAVASGSRRRSDIYTIDGRGKHLHRLTKSGNNSSPVWLPRGRARLS